MGHDDKKVVDTKTTTNTKEEIEEDGTKVTTITTTVVDTYEDGSTSTKTRVQTITEGMKPAEGGPGITTYKGMDDIKAAQEKALKEPVTSSKDFMEKALKAHNKYREKHGVKPLKLDSELCKVAQAWANKMAQVDDMSHSSNGYGENVFWTSRKEVDGDSPVDSWYKEIKDFDFKKGDYQPGTGHFAQVVWKSSEKLGIAYAVAKSGTFVCANYDPAGNFISEYKDNVKPLKK